MPATLIGPCATAYASGAPPASVVATVPTSYVVSARTESTVVQVLSEAQRYYLSPALEQRGNLEALVADLQASASRLPPALREGLAHPDLTPFIEDGRKDGLTMADFQAECVIRIPGGLDPYRGAEIEEAIWDRMHFASHLRSNRLGEFTAGTELQRSESLAIVQLLILYHLITARAAIALGGPGTRAVGTLAPARATGEPARVPAR